MIKRGCLAVLLIIVLIMQEPCFSKAGSLYDGECLQNNKLEYYPIEVYEKENVQKADEIQLKYYLNGGTNSSCNEILYTIEDLPIVLYAPTREGYNFAGWYTDSRFSKKIKEITVENVKDYAVYAKWTKRIDDAYNVQMYPYQNNVYNNSIEKKLKNCEYGFLSQFAIPGMPSTREAVDSNQWIMNTSQYPQGICLTEEYLLVSAYSSKKEEAPGYIHVFDKICGAYRGTLTMKEESHLGGLAYDGKNIWVCHSDNNTLECIPYSFIERMVSHQTQKVVDCTNLFETYAVLNSPSCVAYYDNKLWVATHRKSLESEMISYALTARGLEPVNRYRIPNKVQGVTFDESGLVYISASYGRKNSSYIKVYASVEDMDRAPYNPITKVEMPPCSEEITLEGEQILVLFESAGEKYFEGTDGKGRSLSPIEKVLTIAKSSIFP